MSSDLFSMWANSMIGLQRQYLDAMQRGVNTPAASFEAGSTGGRADPWQTVLNNWWEAAGADVPPPISEFYTRLIEQVNKYHELTREMGEAFGSTQTSDEARLHAADRLFGDMRRAFEESTEQARNSIRESLAFWEMPVDAWQRTHAGTEWIDAIIHMVQRMDPGTAASRGNPFAVFQAPGIGLTREMQEQVQTLGRLSQEYQAVLAEYTQAHAEIGAKSVERMRVRVTEWITEGKELESTRELYDLWVDCCEEEYAAHVSSDEYAALQGRLVNALNALRQHTRQMADGMLGALNLPTRQELDTLHQRFHDLRRREVALQAEIKSLKQRLAAQEAREAEEPARNKANGADREQTTNGTGPGRSQPASQTKDSPPKAGPQSASRKSADPSKSTTKQSKPATSKKSTAKQSKPATSKESTTKQSKPATSKESTAKQSKPATSKKSTTKQSKPATSKKSTAKQSKPAARGKA